MRMIDADALLRALTTIERLARSDAQKALLGRVFYIVDKQPVVPSAHLLTLGEIKNSLKTPFWKETKSGNKFLYNGWVLAYDIQTGQGITGTRLGMSEPSGRMVWYKLDDYGKKWRCWTSCPTDEQRKAVEWDEVD